MRLRRQEAEALAALHNPQVSKPEKERDPVLLSSVIRAHRRHHHLMITMTMESGMILTCICRHLMALLLLLIHLDHLQ